MSSLLKSLCMFLCMILLGTSLSGCNNTISGTDDNGKADKSSSLVEISKIPENLLDFGLSLFQRLSNGNKDNVFISPTSISLALSMVLNGASGQTAEQMIKTLGWSGMTKQDINNANKQMTALLKDPDKGVALSIANSIWARKGCQFSKDFLKVNKDYYGAGTETLDFNSPDAAKTMNLWVKKNTGGLIDKIVESPIKPETIMFLINAIYFKGAWEKPFDQKATTDGKFTSFDGKTQNTRMMNKSGTFSYYSGEGFQAVRLPYGTGKLGMYIFLPDEGKKLDEFINGISSKDIKTALQNFSMKEGSISLPRFKIEYGIELSDVLKKMGIQLAFDENKADFSKMYDTKSSMRTSIDKVKHKTFIEVDEVGTKAAAVTSVEIQLTSIKTDVFKMVMDRPFVYAIFDNETNTLLFIGSAMSM